MVGPEGSQVMDVLDGLEQLPRPLGYPIMAIGVFDGVHLGHQIILRQLVERAHDKQGTALLLTFSPHPQKIISPADAPPLLQTEQQKERMLGELGVDVMVRVPFTRRLSLYTPEQFVREVLYNHGIREIHVGSNFRFGHRRSGDLNALKSLGDDFDLQVREIKPVYFRGRRISSTYIRKTLQAGSVALGRRLLRRPYQIQGVVVRGSGKGVEVGFPTANLEPENELIPANGVYVTRTYINGKMLLSVTNIGHRPTVHRRSGSRPVVETHLLDFSDNLYGKSVSLDFCFRLRAEKKFSGVPELRKQIDRDIERTREYSTRAMKAEEKKWR